MHSLFGKDMIEFRKYYIQGKYHPLINATDS